jgi:hypothetical protein
MTMLVTALIAMNVGLAQKQRRKVSRSTLIHLQLRRKVQPGVECEEQAVKEYWELLAAKRILWKIQTH